MPFTAGAGSDPDVAITPNGTAFVAYNTAADTAFAQFSNGISDVYPRAVQAPAGEPGVPAAVHDDARQVEVAHDRAGAPGR